MIIGEQMIELEEISPGKWRIKRAEKRLARSDLPIPYVISDQMEPTEQVDGKFYTSKRAFRAVGRANGLTEVGTEKFKPKKRFSNSQEAKTARREAIKNALGKAKR